MSKHTFTRRVTIAAENTYTAWHLCISFTKQPRSSCDTVFNAVIIFSGALCSHNFPRLQHYLWVRWETVIKVKETSGPCKRRGRPSNATLSIFTPETWRNHSCVFTIKLLRFLSSCQKQKKACIFNLWSKKTPAGQPILKGFWFLQVSDCCERTFFYSPSQS